MCGQPHIVEGSAMKRTAAAIIAMNKRTAIAFVATIMAALLLMIMLYNVGQKADTALRVAEEVSHPIFIMDEPLPLSGSFNEDTGEDVTFWEPATCNTDDRGPIVRTNGEVVYMPDKYLPPNKSLELSVSAKFDEHGTTDRVVFSTPNKAIGDVIPLNQVNRDASPQEFWANQYYSAATMVDTVAVVAPPGEGWYSGDYWMICRQW